MNTRRSMATEVTLDILSGLPNPSWSLDSDQEAALSPLLEASLAQPETGQTSEPQGLGYRGFIVREENSPEMRVYEGIVWVAGRTYPDPERELEKNLLRTAGANLDEDLMAFVTKELEREK